MWTHFYGPAPPLSECIDIFWLSEKYAPEHSRERLMPSGMMNLVISWDASGIWTGICGVQTKSMFLDTSAPLNVFGVSFKAGGGIPFLPMPNGELHNLQVPLDAVWSVSQARAVSEELSQRRFIDLFREFAGVTPSMYLRFRASRNHVVGHD